MGQLKEKPDDLIADATVKILDAVSVGVIEGLADPDNRDKCVYFDDVPLQNPDGSYNFDGVVVRQRRGRQNQSSIRGYSQIETQTAVNIKVEKATPVSQTITDADVDRVRVTIGTNQFTKFDPDKGEIGPALVDFDIEMQVDGAAWERVGHRRRLKGKSTGGYQRGYTFRLPAQRPVSVRVVRVTDDSSDFNLKDEIFFSSIIEIVDAKLSYPGTAMIGVEFPAETFGGRIPRRTYKIKGVKCLVPSNYDPVARTYDPAIWDGSFVSAWTCNPAWVLYHLLTDPIVGLGERIDAAMVDKWSLYEAAQYCDELVDDGRGGQEPRFSFHGVLDRAAPANEVIREVSASMRAVTYWGAAAVQVVQDRPAAPVKMVTNAHVIDGEFSYSGTKRAQRHNSVIVSCRDPEDHFAIKAVAVHDDPDHIARFGRREKALILPHCISDGEGLRAARWVVDVDTRATEAISYQAGLDHAGIRPGDIVRIIDKHRIGFRTGGRIFEALAGATGYNEIRIDSDFPASAGVDSILVEDSDGNLHEGVIDPYTTTAPALADRIVRFTPKHAVAWKPGGAWAAYGAADPTEWKILSNQWNGDDTFSVAGVQHDPTRHARVETGLQVELETPYLLPPTAAPAPPAGLTLLEAARADAGSASKPYVIFGWDVPADPRVTKWQAQIRPPGGVWQGLRETFSPSTDFNLPSGVVDGYAFRVRAVSLDGQVSVWAEVVFDAAGAAAPSPPQNLAATPGLARNVISWTIPADPDFYVVEVYAGPDTNFGNAGLIGASPSDSLPEEDLGVSETRYYWARTVTHATAEPFSNFTGPVSATTRAVSSALLEDDSILISKLAGETTGYIDNADAANAADIIAEASARVSGDAANAAAITSEENSRISADAAEASARQTLEASLSSDIGAANAAIAAETTTRANADSALASDITTLFTETADNAAAISSETTARIAGDNAEATARLALASTVDDNTAAISAETTARTNAVSALASDITSLTATVGGNTASISAETSARIAADGTITAEKTVTFDVNGRVTGYGFIAGAKFSEFGVRTDRFTVARPDGTGSKSVFVIGQVDGVDEVAISGNLIVDGTISARHIATGSITASEIAAGTITATEIALGTILGNRLNNNTVTNAKIASSAISATKITSGAISTPKLAANAITADKIAANTITANELAANTITANELAANSVTATEANFTTLTALNLSVATAEIDNLAVANGKIADEATSAFDVSGNTTTSAYGNYASNIWGNVVAITVVVDHAGQLKLDAYCKYENTSGSVESDIRLRVSVDNVGPSHSRRDEKDIPTNTTRTVDWSTTRTISPGTYAVRLQAQTNTNVQVEAANLQVTQFKK